MAGRVVCCLSCLGMVSELFEGPLCHYFLFFSVDFKRVQCRLSNLRKGHVALLNLRVKGPSNHSNGPKLHCVKGRSRLNTAQIMLHSEG